MISIANYDYEVFLEVCLIKKHRPRSTRCKSQYNYILNNMTKFYSDLLLASYSISSNSSNFSKMSGQTTIDPSNINQPGTVHIFYDDPDPMRKITLYYE